MTAREALGSGSADLHDRLDRVLDGEDAIIVLMDRNGATSFCHGFGASGCQLELLGHFLEATLQTIAAGARMPDPVGAPRCGF